MSEKCFSKDDHVIVSFIVEFVFPMLDGHNNVRWLREIISSYYNWNGFFTNARWNGSVSKNYHNTLTKEVMRRKKILDVIKDKDHEYVSSRERMNDELAFIVSRIGPWKPKLDAYILNDVEKKETDRRIQNEYGGLMSCLTSAQPKLVVHYLLILGLIFKSLKATKTLRQNVTLYSFVDYVTNSLRQ